MSYFPVRAIPVRSAFLSRFLGVLVTMHGPKIARRKCEEIAAAGSFKLRDGALVMKGAPGGAATNGPAGGPADGQLKNEQAQGK